MPGHASFHFNGEKIAAAALHTGLTGPRLLELALLRGEAKTGAGYTLLVKSGARTGRSAEDKYFTAAPAQVERIWLEQNKLLDSGKFDLLWADFCRHLSDREVFIQDTLAGADPSCSLKVRIVTELAWHSLYSRYMLRPEPTGREPSPDFLLIDCPSFRARPERHGCRSETVIAINLEKRIVLIGGTGYSGEIKKSVFTLVNFLYPDRDVLPMHCAANQAPGDTTDSAIFFGLSGTGKTTLSATSERELIGDDEHAWTADGIFNIENGCYAKVLNLTALSEPEIYAASTAAGTILENVVFDPQTRQPDFADDSITANGRSSYPLSAVAGASSSGMAGHPKHIFMLTCDMNAVLPPIAKLTPDQAMHHFLSGYTARIPGTEQGLTQPKSIFSACFGSPFLPLHPEIYGRLLKRRIQETGAACWLVNTGWTGGGYGVGKRIPLAVTRALISAALSGSLEDCRFAVETGFGLAVPQSVPSVPGDMLMPRRSWQSETEYDAAAAKIAGEFSDNFARFKRS
ncbi:MAG: phosphoenolpyruvate carboxykinase (ATP) [Rhodobacteraceae bacterium]|nr:phosphoenolpyruvate carboxykinase (ATP) [Paracoccaceae bacterium]